MAVAEFQDRRARWKSDNPIAVWRQRVGLTQQSLAEQIGTSVSKVSGWETGDIFPSWTSIERLARRMGRDPARLEFAMRVWDLRRPERR